MDCVPTALYNDFTHIYSLKGAVGEVVFSRREAAEEAIKLYDNKYLDGRKMELILIENGQYVTKKSPKSTSTSCLKNASNERKESTNKSIIGSLKMPRRLDQCKINTADF